ncbi:ESPR-type extended signal peptide-containing protein [Veillonella parvula]|uniref:ESPR-type extended signal peptide-containing protein n=1 Tax=Veillonella parvula TaxID=29466 RepID=UPI001960C969|nr:ESPR-type extended signal peptide-containing protein [Veillonella parvula]VTY47405.1 Autotransporter adhesin BtaF [Veillonella parvula]
MNKIFKVVWSKSKNCYVVVSEFAKNNSGKKKIVVAAILAALAMTNASISMAANTLPTNMHATAVGLGAGASVTGDKAVGFGQNVAAAGGYSIAIGANSSTSVNSPQGIAIGGGNTANEGARVIGEQAIAIGGNTIAQGNSSIVIGGDDVVKADGVKVIYTTNNGENKTGDLRSAVQSLTGFDMRNPLYTSATAGESGITLGMKGQSGNVGIAIGTGANAKDRLSGTSSGASGQANNDVTNAIAIGTGARANRDNAIAIGGGSNTDVGGTKQSSYTLPNNVVASWAGGDKTLPGDVVSFGSKGYERQLKHVAPGEVSATSTDAINGSQLSAIVDQIAYKYISIKSSDVANKDNTGATADNSIAIGPNAATDASASRSVAVGDGARGKVVDGVAVGSKSIADIASGVAGYNVNTSRTDIYAGLSGAALTSKLGGVAVGTTNQTRQINYVAAGTADTDAVNVAQLKSVNLAFTGDTGTGDVNLANSKLAVNGDNTYISTTANGKKITVSGKKQDITVANGSATASAGMADSANVANAINQAIDQNKYGWNLSANGEATPVAVEKGNTVDFSGDDNVAVARNDKKISVALKKDLSKLNSASFNNASGNETVKIDGDKGINAGNLKVANVADGVADKDAVNVSQLKKVDDKAEANKTAIDTNKTAIAKNAGDIATNKTDIATNKDSIAANTQKIADNKTTIDKNTGEIATNKGDIASNKANIAQNTAAIARKISLGGNSGSTDEKSLNTGDVKFNVKGENGLTTVANGDDVTVKLDDVTKNKLDNAADRDLSNLTPNGKQQVKDLAAWNVVANNETAEKVEGNNTVKFIDGDNISITQNGKDFTISTKKDVTFDTVTATQTITAPKVKATTGVETPQVTGLTNTAWTLGQTQPVSGRAATEDQLKYVDDQVAENKANIADNTDKIGKNADAIATNKDNIADNKQKIADNKDAITKNASEIAINKGDIASNKANIAQNTTAIARKISLGGNSGSTDEKSLSTGDVKFNVKGENGLTTVANGDDVTVKLDDATKGKVDNAADRDLSNLTDAGKQQVKDLAAWHVVANNETAEKVEGGNTVKFIDGDNISITQNGKDFTISTKKDVTFDTVTATQTITAPKVKATTGVETPQVTGLTNTAWVPGQTQPVSGRAATEDQLKHVDDQVAENKANIADNTDKIGKNADAIADNKQKIADNKTAIDKNAGNIATNKDNIAANKADIAANTDKIGKNADAISDNKQKIADNKTAITKNTGDIATNKGDIASNKANIAQNTAAIARKISLGGNSGSTDEKSLSTGDVKFNVKGENGLTTVANGDDVTVKLDDTTKGKIENAADRDLSNLTPDGKQQVKDLAAWHVVANNETAEKVEGGNTVKFIDGDNISITQNGKDFTISTKKDVTFDTVTATQTITAPKVKATTGVETPQVTGLTNTAWVPGQTQPVSGRAATEDQLKHVDDQVAENKANIADNTDKIGKNADAIADNKQKIADNKTAIDKNAADITTNKDNIADNKQKIADNKTAIDKNAGDIATNKDNIAANKQNIADNKAAITKNASDIATNKDNIDKNTTAIGRKISLGGNSGSTNEKSLSTGDVKFNVKGENGLTTVANGDDVTVKLDDATKGKVDNAADRDLSNLTPDGKQQVKDLAAWNVVANNETAEKVEGGNTVKFIDGDNISITQNGKDFTVSTKKDVTFDTVTATQTITAPKVKATTKVETPQVTGLTNTVWVPGQTQPVSGRAATEDQLKHVDDQVAENKANIADNTDKIGKNADAIADNKQKIADNKTAIDKNTGDIATNKADISTNKDNIAINKANIDKNTTAIGRKISLGGNSGSTDEKSLSTGDVKFNVKGENGLTTVANGDDVTVKLDDTTKGKVDNAADRDLSNLTPDGKQQIKNLAAWNVVANNETAEKVEGGNTVKFIDGDNISITQNGKDFTVSTKKDVTFGTVTATQTITAPKVKATTGVETPQVTGLTNTAWTPGQTQPVSGRAATEDQLKHVDDQVAENKATIADNTDKIGKNADAIADNKQKIADNKTAITKNTDNIATNRQNIADNKAAITKNASDIVTNKDNIATNKANIDKNTTAIGRKISLGGNSGSTDEKSLSTGDVKFNVKGENGLTTVANGDDVTVKLDDATKGKVDNAADRDLSNLTPDGKQQVKDLAAWNVVANNEMAEKVEGGNTVKFIDGDNISITQNGKDFTISTKKDVTFDTVTATQTITAPKVKATTGVETPQVTGLTNTAWTLGQTQPVSGRAATEDQLKYVDDQVSENKAKIADNTDKIGKNAEAIADNKQKIADNKAAIDKNAVDIATNKDNIATNKADIATNKDNIATNKQNIADNKAAITKNAGDIAANKANIDKNTEAIGRKISLGGNTGSTDEKSLSTGDVKFNIKGQNGIVTEANGEDVTVKLDDATANKINNAANTDLSNLTDAGKQQVKDLSAWNVVANGNTAEKVEGGNTVKFIDGDNISITQNGKDFTIATKQDVTFNTVKANQTITAPEVKATEGVETPQVTGLTNTAWTPGQTQPVSGRAATEDQLKHVDDQVAENKANIADNTDKIGKNADAIADNKQKIANNKAAIDRNAADIATNKDNIATNKANIDKNTTAIARKISLGGNSGSTDEKSLSTGDVKFNVKGENGLTTVANGDDVTVKLDDATKGKIDNAANQDLSNLTDAGKQQVKDISAWKVTAAGGTVEKVQGGDTVKFQAGDNLVVNQDRTTFTYGLAKDLKGLNSVTVGDENGVSTKITPAGTTVKDAAGNSTTINGGGMSITPADAAANPVSLTVDGLNNGGNQIHGVAPGTADTDAVNVSQLKVSNAGLQEAVNRVATETQRVGAHAAAMAALKPIQYDPLEPTQIMAGIGNYRGETAGAIGIAHYRTEDTMFNVGVSLGTSHNMVNAGVTHKFGGSRERKDAIPERYKAGPISSVYVMQDEVSSLKKENSNQKTVIANQAARLNTLEAENERQRQELAETKQGLDDLRAVVNKLLASKG